MRQSWAGPAHERERLRCPRDHSRRCDGAHVALPKADVTRHRGPVGPRLVAGPGLESRPWGRALCTPSSEDAGAQRPPSTRTSASESPCGGGTLPRPLPGTPSVTDDLKQPERAAARCPTKQGRDRAECRPGGGGGETEQSADRFKREREKPPAILLLNGTRRRFRKQPQAQRSAHAAPCTALKPNRVWQMKSDRTRHRGPARLAAVAGLSWSHSLASTASSRAARPRAKRALAGLRSDPARSPRLPGEEAAEQGRRGPGPGFEPPAGSSPHREPGPPTRPLRRERCGWNRPHGGSSSRGV